MNTELNLLPAETESARADSVQRMVGRPVEEEKRIGFAHDRDLENGKEEWLTPPRNNQGTLANSLRRRRSPVAVRPRSVRADKPTVGDGDESLHHRRQRTNQTVEWPRVVQPAVWSENRRVDGAMQRPQKCHGANIRAHRDAAILRLHLAKGYRCLLHQRPSLFLSRHGQERRHGWRTLNDSDLGRRQCERTVGRRATRANLWRVRGPERRQRNTMKLNEPILTTSPHGEQSLRPCEVPAELTIGNQLFELSANNGPEAIVMTGEELTSLANQWLEYTKTQGTANDPDQRPGAKTNG